MPTAEPLWTQTPSQQSSPATAATIEGAEDAHSAVTLPLVEAEAKATEATNSAALDPSLVAMVNGVPIRQEDYQKQVAQAQTYFLQQPGFDIKSEEGQQALARLNHQVLDWMIDQVLIEQAAQEKGITISEAVVDVQFARVKGNDEARFKAWLSANGLTEATFRQQLRTDLVTTAVRDLVTQSLSKRALQIHARHILLSDEAVAHSAVEQLKAGTNFIKLARQISEDETTRADGGDLGFLPKGVMPPAFDQVAFTLQAGQISDVVRSDFGFHIIQVVEIDPDRAITDEMWPVVQQRAFEDWLAGQRAAATIILEKKG